MSSANALNLDQSQNLSFGKEFIKSGVRMGQYNLYSKTTKGKY